MNKKPKLVVIGGGTGTFVVLSGLKNLPLKISAIVAMTDSGGSTGKLRDQLGVLPPGDLRQALVALANSEETWRKLFTYRFEEGDFKGHNFGNIFLSALEKITGSSEQAIKYASEILNIKGNILPVTFTDCTLCAKFEDGSLVEGEVHIDESYTRRPRISFMYVMPEAAVNPRAEKEVKKANFIIFGPGDLHTSIIPNLLVNGFAETVRNSNAKKVFVVNLMTKRGQTDGFKASDFVDEMYKYLGGNVFDYIIINNRSLDQEIVDWYKKEDNVDPVVDDLDEKDHTGTTIIRADLLSEALFEQNMVDRVKRSLLRHDPAKIGNIITEIALS